jgi:hypothetical protein
MASSYKYLGSNDRVVSSNTLEEVVSGTIGAGWTTASVGSPVYFVQASSGSIHLFDVTAGRTIDSGGDTTTTAIKKSMYNQLAKVLVGHDESGNIQKFNIDTDADPTTEQLQDAFFLNIKRAQFKDRIEKGTVTVKVNVSGAAVATFSDAITGSTTVRTCETGEYGILYYNTASGGAGIIGASHYDIYGLVFYEAGVVVLSPYMFSQYSASAVVTSSNASITSNKYGLLQSTPTNNFSGSTVGYAFNSSSLEGCSVSLASKLNEVSFMSVTELNSTVYFCRAFNNEFNYSSNPTYVSSGQIVVKESDPMAQPVSYITSVGLYDDNNQLLAVAKLSTPIKKTPDTELIARVRLDF